MAAEPVVITAPEGHTSDDRPEVYEENGVIVIRCSALGGCIRNLVAARMGIRAVPFNDKALMRMNEGNIHEPHILAHLQSLGWQTITTQDELELPIAGGRIIVRGHSDGRVVHENARFGERVAEAKAMGRDVWAKWKKYGWAEFRRYAWQFSTYMHTTGLPGIFAAKNRDTGEIDVTLWDEAPVSLTEIKARALKVAAAVELPDCDPVAFPCQRFFIHTGSTAYEIDPFTGLEVKKGTNLPPAPHAVPDDQVAGFEELARAYEEAKEEQARAEAKRKELGRFLMAFLDQHSLKKAVTTGWMVTDVESKRQTLDQKALKAELPDVAAKYTVETTSRYVKVTRREEPEAAA